ncbi:MAG: NUDIX hydrolase [Marinilabiliales bacterium]|nr:MAG: NUDIX hydrolase [Marinilabiliales bacterium]
MIKIFYKNKFILLSEKPSDNSITKINFSDKEILKKELNIFLDTNNSESINIFNICEDQHLDFYTGHFKFIQAAGGIVTNANDELLLIKRLGFTDLPKGKVEKNEIIIDCAAREVSEECGIELKDLSNFDFFDFTFHIYPYKNQYALKETSWFKMTFTKDYDLKPQTEEDISEVFWVNKINLKDYFENMYPELIELMEKY